MKISPFRTWRVLLALAAPVASSQPPATPESAAPDDDLRIRGIFDSALPRTERENSLRLIVHPHLGDLTKDDYLRTALGLRYGITRFWEATAETESYFSHGLKQRAFFQESGFSSFHLGTKYNLGEIFATSWETSVGIDWQRPVGSPPVELTDGLDHLAPYVTFSRSLPDRPPWRVFGGLGYDFVQRTAVPGQLRKNDLGGDAARMSAGVLYQQGALTYTLEAAYATMHMTKDIDRERYSLRPGFIWVIPPNYTPVGREGKWLFGFALDLTKGPDGFDLGASAKLRANFDFKRLLSGHRASASQDRPAIN